MEDNPKLFLGVEAAEKPTRGERTVKLTRKNKNKTLKGREKKTAIKEKKQWLPFMGEIKSEGECKKKRGLAREEKGPKKVASSPWPRGKRRGLLL